MSKAQEALKEYILEHFHYEDGVITRDDRKNPTGSYDKDGYLIIKVKGIRFKAHRIAWLLCYGDFPSSELDHINRVRNDNRIENLREATRDMQHANTTRIPNKKTGKIGIYVDESTKGLKKKYTTTLKGKMYRFYSLSDAVAFRKSHNLWV